jgi:hypothetical protein
MLGESRLERDSEAASNHLGVTKKPIGFFIFITY